MYRPRESRPYVEITYSLLNYPKLNELYDFFADDASEMVITMGLHPRLSSSFQHSVVLDHELACYRSLSFWNGKFHF